MSLRVPASAVAPQVSLVPGSPERVLCTRPFGKGVAVGVPQQASDSVSQPPGGCGPPCLPGAHCSTVDQIPKLPGHRQSNQHWAASSLQSVAGGALGWEESGLGSGLEHCCLRTGSPWASHLTSLVSGSSFINGHNDGCPACPQRFWRDCARRSSMGKRAKRLCSYFHFLLSCWVIIRPWSLLWAGKWLPSRGRGRHR